MSPSESLLEARPVSSSTVDVIIPVYNEEAILRSQLEPVLAALPPGFTLKVIENGSTDGTPDILRSMSAEHPQLEFVSLPHPNYGLAMKTGIAGSGTDIVIVDDLDVLDLDFWERGLKLLGTGEVDLVQGSKVLAGKDDRRPLMRRAATLTLTFLLRTLLGYRGTDTHGPKVVWRETIRDIPEQCRLELDIFPTELVIRAQRAGVRIREIPIHLKEIRETPFPLYRRVPRALRDIWRLHRTLKRGGRI
ncbi:MAG: glycosyltransferase [Candidatus Fermentibacteraceae bacterium]|nr:glycosyltransferase [Candidatus Fermentibacteraceae bacterium]MBN2608088.1 glycosyltransferase [Candidatus Fermentibacteraceae bacterium]